MWQTSKIIVLLSNVVTSQYVQYVVYAKRNSGNRLQLPVNVKLQQTIEAYHQRWSTMILYH